ncbi:phenol hydroxylase, putative [Pseudooceanicola batsensis HTCC2597]|uniref:Phenol hydroxylase, putative n=1 Tax=Pseudooceanicola batsensis (strain ATCC BAA-863 / DSM 15984 / KCTC 12145 / HTCC2597) TaxID=252305 RepID=A3TWR1_PSEBH|nr:phenol hydroxylase, putative [Pseudooceanicola batsensis HTCC2597]
MQRKRARRVGCQVFGPHPGGDVTHGGAVARQPLSRRRLDTARARETRQEVHRRRADESTDEDRGRALVDFQRRPRLLDPAGIHDHQLVGQRHRLELIVRHVDRRGSQPLLQIADLDPRLHPQLGIEVRQRLVEEKGGRLAHDGAPHGDALPLTAGELPGLAAQIVLQPQGLRRLAHRRVDGGLRLAPVAQPVGHVVVYAHVRVERIVLEHHRDVALDRLEFVHAAPGDPDFAPRDGLQSRHHAQQGRLAAARRPDQHAKFTRGDVERQVGDDLHPSGIDLADVLDLDLCHSSSYFSVSTRPRTNSRCIPMMTATGGSIARMAVAMIRFHSGCSSPAFAMRWIPMTTV